jgi:hypothetical protein
MQAMHVQMLTRHVPSRFGHTIWARIGGGKRPLRRMGMKGLE